jgi:4-amino-4-deoxy-L-arabinose transferase-like glycosyltransferase
MAVSCITSADVAWQGWRERMTTLRHFVFIVLLLALVILVTSTAPTEMYSKGVEQISTALFIKDGGNPILPRDEEGRLFRKPPLSVWTTAAVLAVTETYTDFVFCLPTLLSTLAIAVMLYFAARFWWGATAGLLAAAFWITVVHMSGMLGEARSDMMFAAWVAGSLLCADRLLFHRAPPSARWKWAVGFWAAMILAGLTKGWGVVNLALVGGAITLASALGPGWRPVRALRGCCRLSKLIPLLLWRRWRRAAKTLSLGWGLAALLVTMGVYIVVAARAGGQAFGDMVYQELWQRATGLGEHAPLPTKVPVFLQEFFFAFPASLFALGSLLLAKPATWFRRRGGLGLPLCWVVAVVACFSMTHGFRPVYLLPSYGGVALLAGWAVNEWVRRAASAPAGLSLARHCFAGATILALLTTAGLAALFLFHAYLPGAVRNLRPIPSVSAAYVSVIVGLLLAFGVLGVAWAVRASLRGRVYHLVVLALLAAVGLIFLVSHIYSRNAVEPQGEEIIAFAREVKSTIGREGVVFCDVQYIGMPLYLGRLGPRFEASHKLPDELGGSGARWLVISERGLLAAGAGQMSDTGSYQFYNGQGPSRFEPQPDQLGTVRLRSAAPISMSNIGRLYLIDLHRAAAGVAGGLGE